jgi:hypothetical protein
MLKKIYQTDPYVSSSKDQYLESKPVFSSANKETRSVIFEAWRRYTARYDYHSRTEYYAPVDLRMALNWTANADTFDILLFNISVRVQLKRTK